MEHQHAPWTRAETLVAFNAYCKIPFQASRSTHPLVVRYATLLGRSPSALNMKIGNIGRSDPELQRRGITGLRHGASLEKEIWAEFWKAPEKIVYESEQIIAGLMKSPDNAISPFEHSENEPNSGERAVIAKQRIGQSFFRAAVLSAYSEGCCISGVKSPNLLQACHIISWQEAPTLRVNPTNGLCLNPFFHKAYDENLISISPDCDVLVSDELLESSKEPNFKGYLIGLQRKKIILPNRFFPNREFLDYHYQQYLNRR